MQRRSRRRYRKKKSSWATLMRHRIGRWICQRETRIVAVALLTLGFVLYVGNQLSHGTRYTVDSGDYHGIDVSKFQGRIDWDRVARDSHIQFVYIKATEGATMVDSRYEENIRKARAAGLKVGSYHFFNSYKPARLQFNNFCRYVNRRQQDLLPMVDVEQTGNSRTTRQQLQRNLSEFMQLVKDEYGVYPILYSQYRFYNQMLAPEFNRYYIFIARYGRRQPTLSGGGKYNIWQYSERGHIDGIRGYVDIDRFGPGTSLRDIEY